MAKKATSNSAAPRSNENARTITPRVVDREPGFRPYKQVPSFALAESLPWLKDVSLWSAPPAFRCADIRDGFLLGGGGHLSARLGTRDRMSTMERTMAPWLSSYNFAENVNFRQSAVTPSRDFYPPFTFRPTWQHIWRIRGTAIVLTAERDDTYELITVNAVHPTRHVFLRHATLKNISDRVIEDIGISFTAPVDVPFPIAGHRSLIIPLNECELSERVEELKPIGRDYGPHYSNEVQRNRFMVRGLIAEQGTVKTRGYEDLFAHWDAIPAGESVKAIQYLAPGLRDNEESAIESAQLIRHHLEVAPENRMLQEIYDWWSDRASQRAHIDTDHSLFADLIDTNTVLQDSVERATGGYVVIDDYTGSWLRDHNGPHLQLLALGEHERIKRSMDRYYGLDISNRSLYSVYASDSEPLNPLPPEPDWQHVDGFVTGDVPNFRTMWYWWYVCHTGDLEPARARFNYLSGAFHRQRLHEKNYLAEYCFDETYGIGPVGPMRTGLSCDNSFNALAAARRLGDLAELLGRDDVGYYREYATRIHEAIEQTFWLEKEQYYAMRVRPDGTLDTTPLSIGLLRPLWIGAADQSYDHAVSSALYAYTHLYHENGFLRLIPSHDQTVTMAIGYLLNAMKKMSHPDIDRVLNDMLTWADPSGTFGEYLDEHPDGPWQCYEHMAHRNRMWESGINISVLLDALTGFAPQAFRNHVALAPYLPGKWDRFSARDLKVGGSRISIEHERQGAGKAVTLSQESGEGLTVALKLQSPTPSTVTVNGEAFSAASWQKNQFGISTATLTLALSSGVEHTILY